MCREREDRQYELEKFRVMRYIKCVKPVIGDVC